MLYLLKTLRCFYSCGQWKVEEKMADHKFVYDIYIETTVEKLWEALTSSEYTEKYFFGSKIQSD